MNLKVESQFNTRNKILKTIGFNNYKEYLNSYFWRKTKDRVNKKKKIKEYWRKCWACGTIKNIHLHHIKYTKLLKANLGSHIFPLCGKCHQRTHELSLKDNQNLKGKHQRGLKYYMKQVRKGLIT